MRFFYSLLLLLGALSCSTPPPAVEAPTENISSDFVYSYLFQSVKQGDILQISQFFSDEGDLNYINKNLNDSQGNTLLHVAIQNNQFEIAQLLIENELNVNIQNAQKQTALHLLLKQLDHHISNPVSEEQMLHKAVFDVLFDDSDLKIQNFLGETPLHIICKKDQPEIFDTILDGHFIDGFFDDDERVNLQDYTGDTCLHKAVRYNQASNVEKILDRASSEIINIQNNIGDTALHLAVKNNRVELIDLILSHSPDLTLKNAQKQTVLDLDYKDEIKNRLQSED